MYYHGENTVYCHIVEKEVRIFASVNNE